RAVGGPGVARGAAQGRRLGATGGAGRRRVRHGFGAGGAARGGRDGDRRRGLRPWVGVPAEGPARGRFVAGAFAEQAVPALLRKWISARAQSVHLVGGERLGGDGPRPRLPAVLVPGRRGGPPWRVDPCRTASGGGEAG